MSPRDLTEAVAMIAGGAAHAALLAVSAEAIERTMPKDEKDD